MTQEALKLALETSALAKDVLKQVNRLVAENEALKKRLAEHAMRETQRLGQEIEQEPVAILNHAHGVYTFRNVNLKGLPDGEYLVYTFPPQRTEQEPDDIASIIACRDMLDAQPVPPKENT